jgi:hypothetical protein
MHDQEHFNSGLIQAQQNALQMADQYRAGRDMVHPVPYTQPQLEPYRSTSDELTRTIIAVGKPVIALSVYGGTVAIIVATVVGVIGSGLAFIGANAGVIGGGFLAVVVLGLAVFGGREVVGSGETGSGGKQAQSINVTVNVGGTNATVNQK